LSNSNRKAVVRHLECHKDDKTLPTLSSKHAIRPPINTEIPLKPKKYIPKSSSKYGKKRRKKRPEP
jgi:hypothetical protein